MADEIPTSETPTSGSLVSEVAIPTVLSDGRFVMEFNHYAVVAKAYWKTLVRFGGGLPTKDQLVYILNYELNDASKRTPFETLDQASQLLLPKVLGEEGMGDDAKLSTRIDAFSRVAGWDCDRSTEVHACLKGIRDGVLNLVSGPHDLSHGYPKLVYRRGVSYPALINRYHFQRDINNKPEASPNLFALTRYFADFVVGGTIIRVTPRVVDPRNGPGQDTLLREHLTQSPYIDSRSTGGFLYVDVVNPYRLGKSLRLVDCTPICFPTKGNPAEGNATVSNPLGLSVLVEVPGEDSPRGVPANAAAPYSIAEKPLDTPASASV